MIKRSSVSVLFAPGRLVFNGTCLDDDSNEVVLFCVLGNNEEVFK